MNLNWTKILIGAGVVIFTALTATTTQAQNLQSASNSQRMHANLLAKQNRIQDRIRLEEAQQYATDLYEEVEPEPDIYTEGWESDRVNPYKNAIVPNSKVIDVRNYVMPIKGNYVTSHYGYRPRFGRNHKGVDLRLSTGDTVRAAFAGKVRLTKYERGGYGFYVIVRHDNGLETVYGHLSRFLVKPNQVVKAGQPIALGGSTGRSTGPHLHFETRFMGYAINPEAIFDFEARTTHTDSYTFRKSTYTQPRNYRPSTRTYTASRAKARKARTSYSSRYGKKSYADNDKKSTKRSKRYSNARTKTKGKLKSTASTKTTKKKATKRTKRSRRR